MTNNNDNINKEEKEEVIKMTEKKDIDVIINVINNPYTSTGGKRGNIKKTAIGLTIKSAYDAAKTAYGDVRTLANFMAYQNADKITEAAMIAVAKANNFEVSSDAFAEIGKAAFEEGNLSALAAVKAIAKSVKKPTNKAGRRLGAAGVAIARYENGFDFVTAKKARLYEIYQAVGDFGVNAREKGVKFTAEEIAAMAADIQSFMAKALELADVPDYGPESAFALTNVIGVIPAADPEPETDPEPQPEPEPEPEPVIEDAGVNTSDGEYLFFTDDEDPEPQPEPEKEPEQQVAKTESGGEVTLTVDGAEKVNSVPILFIVQSMKPTALAIGAMADMAFKDLTKVEIKKDTSRKTVRGNIDAIIASKSFDADFTYFFDENFVLWRKKNNDGDGDNNNNGDDDGDDSPASDNNDSSDNNSISGGDEIIVPNEDIEEAEVKAAAEPSLKDDEKAATKEEVTHFVALAVAKDAVDNGLNIENDESSDKYYGVKYVRRTVTKKIIKDVISSLPKGRERVIFVNDDKTRAIYAAPYFVSKDSIAKEVNLYYAVRNGVDEFGDRTFEAVIWFSDIDLAKIVKCVDGSAIADRMIDIKIYKQWRYNEDGKVVVIKESGVFKPFDAPAQKPGQNGIFDIAHFLALKSRSENTVEVMADPFEDPTIIANYADEESAAIFTTIWRELIDKTDLAKPEGVNPPPRVVREYNSALSRTLTAIGVVTEMFTADDVADPVKWFRDNFDNGKMYHVSANEDKSAVWFYHLGAPGEQLKLYELKYKNGDLVVVDAGATA